MRSILLLAFCALTSLAWAFEAASAQPATKEPEAKKGESKTEPKEPETKAPEGKAGEGLKEEDLLGLYLQASTGALMQFEKDGKLSGWPMGGSYKFIDKNRIEMASGEKEKAERLELTVARAKEGLLLTRTVKGEEQQLPLFQLAPVKVDAAAWQGACIIRALVAGEKTATNREVRLDAEGKFMTKEGGHYLRMFERDGKTMAYASGLEEETKLVSLYKVGRVLVLFDRLQSPTLLAIVQLRDGK